VIFFFPAKSQWQLLPCHYRSKPTQQGRSPVSLAHWFTMPRISCPGCQRSFNVLAAHLARNPVCHSVVRQQRRERQRDVNPCIRQWRESLLGMFVGGDARAGINI
jgi:hypothetical protein